MKLIYGGTYDPVHNGHITMAVELVSRLGVDCIYLMPCFEAVHKNSVSATSQERLDMLRLATAPYSELEVDDREIKRGMPSYTYDSLVEIRSEIGNESLCLVMGTDTAMSLESWRNIQNIPSLTNIVILKRPDPSFSESDNLRLIAKLNSLGWKVVNTVNELSKHSAGICILLELSQVEVSSTEVREAIRQNNLPVSFLPNEVKSYICDNKLYLQ